MYIHPSGKLAKHKFTWEQSSELAKHEELDIVYSVIIGHGGMVDCISKQKNGKGSDSIWIEPGCFHWIFRNPVLFRPAYSQRKRKA